jgi:hypothetical protein
MNCRSRLSLSTISSMTPKSSPSGSLADKRPSHSVGNTRHSAAGHNSFDTTPYGDRSIRASLSGDVAIRYTAVVENSLRRLLPQSGLQHVWSDLPSEVLPFLLPSRFCPSDKFMRFAQREFSDAGDGVAQVMRNTGVDPSQRRLCRRREQCRDHRRVDICRPGGSLPRIHPSRDYIGKGARNIKRWPDLS